MRSTKFSENYLNTAALLRKEIAELRSCQKRSPQQSAAYEKKISLLFETYTNLLDASLNFTDGSLQEEVN